MKKPTFEFITEPLKENIGLTTFILMSSVMLNYLSQLDRLCLMYKSHKQEQAVEDANRDADEAREIAIEAQDQTIESLESFIKVKTTAPNYFVQCSDNEQKGIDSAKDFLHTNKDHLIALLESTCREFEKCNELYPKRISTRWEMALLQSDLFCPSNEEDVDYFESQHEETRGQAARQPNEHHPGAVLVFKNEFKMNAFNKDVPCNLVEVLAHEYLHIAGGEDANHAIDDPEFTSDYVYTFGERAKEYCEAETNPQK